MARSIEIVNGKRGYHLKVNGMFISHGFASSGGSIKAIKNQCGIPCGATEWVSVKAIRNFWAKYMPMVILSTIKPYRSVGGQLELIK